LSSIFLPSFLLFCFFLYLLVLTLSSLLLNFHFILFDLFLFYILGMPSSLASSVSSSPTFYSSSPCFTELIFLINHSRLKLT
jgi:hypothetical protein